MVKSSIKQEFSMDEVHASNPKTASTLKYTKNRMSREVGSSFNRSFYKSKKFATEMRWKGTPGWCLEYPLRNIKFPKEKRLFDDWVYEDFLEEDSIESERFFDDWVYDDYLEDEFPFDDESPLDPQIGIDLSNFLTNSGDSLSEAALNWIESLTALYASLRECQSLSQFVGISTLFIKNYTQGSVTKKCLDYMYEVIGMDAQAAGEDSSTPEWLRLFKIAKVNWGAVIKCDAFKKISKFISMAVSVGLCQLSSFQFDICGVKAFSLPMTSKHATAVDFIDCIVDTIAYFVEGGYQCFRSGSIRPFFTGDAAMLAYEEAYAKCLECAELARSGNLEKFKGMSENDFDKLLTDTVEMCSNFIKSSHPGTEKNLLLRQREKLLSVGIQFRQTRLEGGLRVAPYAIGIFGGSGVGKSSLANLLMTCTLQMNGFCADDDRVVTLNEGDKFMSNYRSYINGIFLDDLGNTRSEYVEGSPAQRIIELVNNVRAYAVMAEADMKGKVSIEPKCVVITRNVKSKHATTYSNEPASILRREKITLTVRVKEGFATNNMLDSEKVYKHYDGKVPVFPDIWSIDIQRAYPHNPNPNDENAENTFLWETIKEDASLEYLIKFLKKDSEIFFEQQRDLVERSKDSAKHVATCTSCKLPAQYCSCCKEEDEKVLDQQASYGDDSLEALQDHVKMAEAYVASVTDEAIDEIAVRYRKYREAGLLPPLPEKIHKAAGFASSVADEKLDEFAAMYRMVREYEIKYPQTPDILKRTAKYTSSLAEEQIDRVAVLYRRVREIDNSWICPLTVMPDWLYASNVGAIYREKLNKDKYYDWFKEQTGILLALAFLSLYVLRYKPLWFLPYWLAVSVYFVVQFVCYRNTLLDELATRREAVPELFKNFRANQTKWILGSCAAIAGIYGVVQVYRAYKRVAPQGNLAPKSMADIEARDKEQNPWCNVVSTPMTATPLSQTMTHSEVCNRVRKSLCYMEYTLDKKRVFCNAFFVGSNMALIPQHIWKSPELEVTFTRASVGNVGSQFTALLSQSFSVDIPNSDLCLTWVPNGGVWKNLLDLFPLSAPPSCPASLIYRMQDGDVDVAQTRINPGTVRSYKNFPGYNYELDKPTFMGLCMAPIVSQTKAPAIVGFHLAGRTGQTTGAAGSLTRSQLEKAISRLRTLEGVLVGASEATIPCERYDIDFFETDALHPKSPAGFLSEQANMNYYGQVKGRASYHSEVIQTPISPLVKEVCGVENMWGKPKFHSWKPWQASLEHATHPSPGMPGAHLQAAVTDYREGFMRHVRDFPVMLKEVKPLTKMETVCGKDGKRFIDKLVPGTSVGYPLGGPKRDHLTLLDPVEHPTHACPAELDERFWDEAQVACEKYLRGERAYPIFKGCLKDEPTPLNKDKVRVFQSAPLELQLLIRKYYLPIARLLSVFPLMSECAVGINAQGPEWQQFTEHITKYGKDRIFAGDYSKYDLRMPSELVLSAFRVLIDIARECGYSKEDICIMEGIATDVAYPLMAYNGDLLMLFGSNPSGQNLTVYINSIVNSLLVRCYLYHLGYLRSTPARDIIAIATYGDDIKGSVKEGYQVTIKGFADFLKNYDMVFTMPDKDSELVDFMTDDDADFLKRKSIYCPELGMSLGALDEMSIFKSLHSVLKSSSVSVQEQCMSNIDGALREWFAHGRDVYETRRAQMQEIAKRADLAHGCRELSLTYADRIQAFREKYGLEQPL